MTVLLSAASCTVLSDETDMTAQGGAIVLHFRTPDVAVKGTMADNACGFAMSTHGFVAVTVNSTFNFMRGAQVGDRLTAEAVEVKGGKTISVYETRVTNQNGDLIASGTFTFFRMEKQLVFPF